MATPPDRPTSAPAPQGKTPARRAARATTGRAAERAYHHGDLREALLTAAEALLVAGSAPGPDRSAAPASFSLRDVARQAGVSHAAPYHHFANRDELLAAVAARAFEQLGAAMHASAAAEAQPREQLLAIAEAYVRFARASPARFRLMFGPLLATRAQHPALDQAAGASFAVLLGAAERLDAKLALPLALTGWSLAHGLSHLLLDEAFAGLNVALPEPELLVRQLSALVLAGR